MTVARAAILGGSGYTGGELLRLLAMHPGIEVVEATSREYKGKPIYYAHPHLRGFYSIRFTSLDTGRIPDVDIVFNALPHGVAVEYTGYLVDHGIRVVDLSADYRLKDPEAYRSWYGMDHPREDLLEESVYGIPELRREEIRGARLVASPGCNATAAILSLAPLAVAGLLSGPVVVDIKAGSSEGGAKPKKGGHHPEREGAARPYSPAGHRHEAEAEQELSRLARTSVRVSLVPHAVSMVRGVLASSHLWVEDLDLQEVSRSYAALYGGERFIRVYPRGSIIDVKNVVGSHMVDVSYSYDERTGRLTAFAALDNLVRGAAGQAVHAANIMLGLVEDLGLGYPPLKP
ncbi:MAG: N-acetyl-gamma-glutamyl-phosphate reductase [Desulfurococcales archaeon]|nr:N-acetyl-gamma-glutamyl-phosphate reductase [Desulfurococcales archaeon]